MRASLVSQRCSYSLLRRRLWPSQEKVRSTAHRRGRTPWKPCLPRTVLYSRRKPPGASVALIDPDVLKPRELLGGTVEQQRDGGPVLQGGRVDLRPEDQPLGL